MTRIALLATLLTLALLPTLPSAVATNPFPFDVHFVPSRNEVWVTSIGWIGPALDAPGTSPGQRAKVHVIDWVDGSLDATIDVGPYYDGSGWPNTPAGLCHAGGALIVCNPGSNEIIRIDMATRAITNRWTLGVFPYHCLADSAGKVWVTFRGEGVVRKIDPDTCAVLATVSVDGGPWRMAMLGSQLLVARFHDDQLAWIDTATATVVHNTPVGDRPNDVCVDPTWPLVYTSDYGGTVTLVSVSTRQAVQTITLDSGAAPHGIYRIDQDLWVINSGLAKIDVYDPVRGVKKYSHATGQDPSFGKATPGSFIYANPLANRVGTIPTAHTW